MTDFSRVILRASSRMVGERLTEEMKCGGKIEKISARY